MRKIGLIGRQGSGKDYFAEQFMQENPNVALVRMADPIKVVSANLFEPIFKQMNLQDNATFEAIHKENDFPIPLTYFKTILKIHIDYLVDLYFANKGCNDGQKLETTKQDLQNKAVKLFQDKMNEIFVVLSPRHFQQIFGTNLFRQHVDVDFWCVIAEEKMKLLQADIIICPDVCFVNETKLFNELIYVDRELKDDLSRTDISRVHASEYLCESVRNHLLEVLQENRKTGYSDLYPVKMDLTVKIHFNKG